MKMLSFSMENYLEVIYNLSLDGKGARLTDIARSLGVAKASANRAVSVLSEKGLAANEKYKRVFLTHEGLKLAVLTSKKHRIIQQFLTDVLKIDDGIADSDACAIEHVISNASVYAMHYFLYDGLLEKAYR